MVLALGIAGSALAPSGTLPFAWTVVFGLVTATSAAVLVALRLRRR